MANISITSLPAALPIDGTELVPIVQGGVTVRATTAAIAGSPSQNQSFLTANLESTLPNSRYVGVGTGLTITDNGSQGVFRISPSGQLQGIIDAPSGFLAKDSSGNITNRSISTTGQGISVTNGSGVNGSPVFQLTDISAAISGLSGYGVITALGTGATIRQLVGTSDQIVIADANGTAGNPTFGIADNPIIPGVESLTIPVGTTAERPAGQDGMIRYNTDIFAYETYSSGSWNSVAAGGVTLVSVVTANGLAGTVADPSTTPAITLSTTVTGMVKGNGTALSAATAATDYVAPSAYASTNGLTMATARLLGRTTASTGDAEEISVAGGLTLSGGVLTGGIGSVTSVSGTGTVNGITLTGTVTTTGDLTLGGTLSGVSLTTQVTGTLPVLNGGTGATIASTARSNLSAAASGVNTDITSIALTTGTVSTTPSAGIDIANKQYVDDTAQGLNFHQACEYASTVNFTAAYNNGASGVGATLTNSGALAAFTIDGYTFVSPGDIGKRVLIKDQSSAFENGAYTVTTVGSGSVPWVLTRATDFDTAGTGANQIDAGDFFYILNGTSYANTSWVQQTPQPITVGVTSIVFIQFGAASGGVSSFSAGTTGFTPNTATTGNVTLGGTLAVANGGTGVVTSTGTGSVVLSNSPSFVTPVLGVPTSGDFSSGTFTWPTFNQNTTGTASNVTGVVATANGGTNLTSFTANGLVYASSTSALATGSALTFDGTNLSTTGQVISTSSGSTTDGTGQVYLNGLTSNRIEWNTEGIGAPAFTTRSVGTKALLYPAISGSQVDYAIGIDAATLWSSIPFNSSSFYFKWYGGETQVASLDGTGAFTAVGGISGGTF